MDQIIVMLFLIMSSLCISYGILIIEVNIIEPLKLGYNLKKYSKPKSIKKIIMPPELKCEINDLEFKKRLNEKIKEKIIKFVNIIGKNLKKDDLNNLYNNIKNIKIKQLKKMYGALGAYYPKKNKIEILFSELDNLSFFHELLHMSSTIQTKKTNFVGFYQSSKKMGRIGYFINEGYTQLLSLRYFKDECKELNNAYQYNVNVVEILEQIVGKETMQSLYFNANLHGLVEELKKYARDEEIMKFIASTDFIAWWNQIPKKETRKWDDCIKYISKFLIKTYTRKLLRGYKQNVLNEEQVKNQLIEFVSSFNLKPEDNKEKYAATSLSREDITSCFEEAFREYNVSFNYEIINNKESKK